MRVFSKKRYLKWAKAHGIPLKGGMINIEHENYWINRFDNVEVGTMKDAGFECDQAWTIQATTSAEIRPVVIRVFK